MENKHVTKRCSFRNPWAVLLVLILVISLFPSQSLSATKKAKVLRIAIMQSKSSEAKKYIPLVRYMNTKGIIISLVSTPNYGDAARKFSNGQVDAMFSGSAVAGIMIMKGIARPLVRPVNQNGVSMYSALVVARKGSPKFDGTPHYFKRKKIACCALASSGEMFIRSVFKDDHEYQQNGHLNCKLLETSSHGAALIDLAKGKADIAVVKNLVYEDMVKNPQYQNLWEHIEVVGRPYGENPNNTLIVSTQLDSEIRKDIQGTLLGVEGDKSSEATRLKRALKITRYIVTTVDDFKYTISLLRDAGVRPEYDLTSNTKGLR